VEGILVSRVIARHGAVVKLALAAVAQEGTRESAAPARTGAGEATRMSEVGGIGHVGDNILNGASNTPMQPAEAEKNGRRETPAPPAKRWVPKPIVPRRAPPQKWRTLRTHREPTSTGARSREV